MVNTKASKNSPGPAASSQNPIDALKIRYVNGEISEEEYKRKKGILGSSSGSGSSGVSFAALGPPPGQIRA